MTSRYGAAPRARVTPPRFAHDPPRASWSARARIGTRTRASAQALVELALVMPIALIMMIGVIELGRAFVFGVSVQQGAREAARYGAEKTLLPSASTEVTPGKIIRRVINASEPALSANVCTLPAATSTALTYTCTPSYGGSWTFTVTYLNAAGSATVTTPTSGDQIRVRAAGLVPLLSGFAFPGWVSFLNQIRVQGEATMVFF